MLDALNRRKRNAPPQPRGRDIEIDEGDLAILSALNRHGLLHTDYLYLFRKPFHHDPTRNQKRLTKLYNGYCEHPEHRKRTIPVDDAGNRVWTHTCDPVRYLTRDPEQEENRYYGRGNSLVYGLTPLALEELNATGLALKYDFRRSNSFGHDFGLGCFTASFELQARKFRFRESLLDHEKCPAATRTERAPFYFESGKEHVYPDDIFGNEYEEGRSRFFALEFDRANKGVRGTASNRMEPTFKAYQEVLKRGSYKRLGIPNLSILIATTLESKMRAMQDCVREVIDPKYQPHFLFKAFPIFGRPWRTPKEPLPVMTGWMDANGREQDISKKA